MSTITKEEFSKLFNLPINSITDMGFSLVLINNNFELFVEDYIALELDSLPEQLSLPYIEGKL